ncbi:U3 small nucleolar RNA-associated protein 18 homolog isoform X2 [Sesamum indicum]|uniref:U3 small nucleolar RNA-associated protein 18 homolog n=1 Tax=Sesamum indicum TaxID=4182 RepID=A0A6I9TFD8_SESIN|nr:U3 small nucleolar RNA-associated protein 18 homolog isoform X1 [Sesamum indicum]XP_011082607.1 U3 small nucleolar RNA-associated protein 18 homolog isoform X2 [Sesamum indicum]
MSLISQNAVPKEPVKKKKKAMKKGEIALLEEGKEEVEDGNEIVLDGTRNQKRKRGQKDNDELMEAEEKEMTKLENFLFGPLYTPVEFRKDDEDEAGEELDNDCALFFTDRTANSVLSVYEEDMDSGDKSTEGQESRQRKKVWVDDEEDKIRINIAKVNRLRKLRKEEDETFISRSEYVARLRAQHIKMNPGTEWARLDDQPRNYSSDDEDSEKETGVVVAGGYEDPKDADNILRINEDLVVKRSMKLLPGFLEYSRLVDANMKDPSSSTVNSVQFHKNGQLFLVGGKDKRLRFFHIDGKKNDMLQSVFFEDYQIYKAAFLPEGSHAILSGRRKFFYTYDLVKDRVDKIGPLAGREEKSLESFEVSPDSKTIAFLGNEGYILIVSTKTKELIGTLKMNGTVRSVAFTNDGQQLLSSGGDGQVYHWDMRTRSCFHIGVDEGCLNGTALCTSSVGNLFAAGSDSGIVNIYNREEFLGGKRKPLKAIENLTTKVDFMKFNHDAQILAIISRMKKNSMKLIHVPSLTVFTNWPPANQTLHHPMCVDFSPRGGFMALGDAGGRVSLYKLHHYHQA